MKNWFVIRPILACGVVTNNSPTLLYLMLSISENALPSSVQELKDFLLGILNGKYEWKDLKKYFVPALTYKEDTDYIDVLE